MESSRRRAMESSRRGARESSRKDIGSSVDSQGEDRIMSSDRGARGEVINSGDSGGKQQTYYCSPPYFSSSSNSSSASSSAIQSPVESHAQNPGAEYRGRAKSGSTGTPLTPQEFELLSDSNPFKQDIAEKYGIAYPSITTRAHSSEFIGQTERQNEIENENSEFGGVRRKKRSASVNDSVDSFTLDISTWKASSEKISRMCKGLNAFLLKNQESIEQSIANLDDTDVVIPTSEGAGVFSAPKKYDIVYVGKQNSSEEINSPVHDISPERLLDAELSEIELEGKRDDKLFSEDYKDRLDDDLQKTGLHSNLAMSRPSKQALEQTKSDPYSAIKSEDNQRKKSGTKLFSDAKLGLGESEDDQLCIKPLSTRSFEEAELRDKSCDKVADSNTLISQRHPPSAKSATSFQNDSVPKTAGFKNDSMKSESFKAADNDGTLSKPISLTSEKPSNISVRTISNVRNDTDLSASGKITHDNTKYSKNNREPRPDEKKKRSREISPPHEVLAAFDPFASVEKTEETSFKIDLDSENVTAHGRGDKFASSFYSVFGTTVSSLEDVDSNTDAKIVGQANTSPEQQASHKSDSSIWEAGDITPGADSVFSGYDRSVSESSHSRGGSSGHPSGELMFQAKSKVSEDSADSSKESASRDSMRVNLSQDSSMADPQDEPSTFSHYHINGFPESDEMLSSQSVINAVPRLEVSFPQRHLDLASMLLPMAESASTDSMFVHLSTDSLHSAGSGRSRDSVGGVQEQDAGDQRKLSDKSSRAQLCIDLRKKNLMAQSRRRSLPLSQMKSSDQEKSSNPVLCTAHSLDSSGVPEHPLQRRSSVPISRPKTDIAKALKCSGSSSAPRLHPQSQASPTPADSSKLADAMDPELSKLQAIPTVQAISPSTARPRPSSKRGSVSSEKGNAVSINLGQVANILAGTTVASTQPTTPKVKVQKPQKMKIQFTIAAKSLEPTPASKPVTSETSSQKAIALPLQSKGASRHPPLSHQAAAELSPESADFLQGRKDAMSSENIMIPPDLVPYEETFSTPLPNVPESSEVKSEEKVGASDASNSQGNLAQADVFDGKGAETEVSSHATDGEKDRANNETQKVSNDTSINKTEGEETAIKSGMTKSNSASDSDGGDIDTIVQEFKEDISDEDNIDDLVKEFIDEHPEAATATPTPQPQPEMTRQHSLGFNKLGRVLNKMQSVTKYMSKKKGEEDSKPPSMSKKGRRSRTNSQNESEEISVEVTAGTSQQINDSQSQAEGGDSERKEETDPFELLSKAADVFKSQTIKKKKSPRAPRVWRSMTIDSEVADLEDNDDCDLITRAAILFKGFKGKKLPRGSDPKLGSDFSKLCEGQGKEESIPESEQQANQGDEKTCEGREVFQGDKVLLHEDASAGLPRKDNQPSEGKDKSTNLPNTTKSDTSDDLGYERGSLEAAAAYNSLADPGANSDNTEMEESTSKMEDSGFESSIRYAAESSVKSDGDDDDTDDAGNVTTLLDSAREHAVFSVVEIITPELSTYEHVTSRLGATIEKSLGKPELTSMEKCSVEDPEMNYQKQSIQDAKADHNRVQKDLEWPESKSNITVQSKTSVKVETQGGTDNCKDGVDCKEIVIITGPGDEHSTATDSGLETEEPRSPGSEQIDDQTSRPVSQTCDLILSTGYDDTKSGKSHLSNTADNADTAPVVADCREKTNGKLDELAKEILAVDAAGLDLATSKTGINKLDIKSPEYQRLSSDSSENPDSNSLTVNLPDSPENGMSLTGDGPFSLCCGRNFKINLNCTAMVKKPERRPSKVVIENKRCAMTEEEKMFPLKVSFNSREDFDKETPLKPSESGVQASNEAESGSKSDKNTLKVNEHERNRNFAGSREELVDQNKTSREKTSGEAKAQHQEEKESMVTEKQLNQQKSQGEDIDKDKQTIDIYNSVLNELTKRQGSEHDDAAHEKETATSMVMKKERARVKRYGRVISESELNDGLLLTDEKTSKADIKDSEPEHKKEAKSSIGQDGFPKEASGEKAYKQVQTKGVLNDPRAQLSDSTAVQESRDIYDNIKLDEKKIRPDAPPPLPVRDSRVHRTDVRHMHGDCVDVEHSCSGHRHRTSTGSVSSVLSDGGAREGIRADVYLKARRAHSVQARGKTKWVSSTPHLPTTEREGRGAVAAQQSQGNRHNSFPHLHANSDLDVSLPPGYQYRYPYRTHHRGHSEGSASSFASESVCWGNYARVADLQAQDRAASYDDSESSTSGLFIPGGGGGIPAGCGRASTLSDVSDGYIFGDYSTVKDDIQGEESIGVIRPLDNQNQQTDYSFRFRHFPAAQSHVHYENIDDMVVTTQPMGQCRQRASEPDIHSDNHYAIIGHSQKQHPAHYRVQDQSSSGSAPPMSSIGVQMSGSPSLARHGLAIRVSNCASQTSLDSLIGLVSHDASDILEGLPVYEYTLGAGLESEDEPSETQSIGVAASTQCPDLPQPDLTRQTASLDRQQWLNRKKKGWVVTSAPISNQPRKHEEDLRQIGAGNRGRKQNGQSGKKETRVTFSRDAVLTEVIDELRRSEADELQQQQREENMGVSASGRGFRDIASSTLTSIGGGVKEFARMINSPFHCCRSARAEPQPKPKVGRAVVL
ncbi:hypothetical protein PoB_002646800 [Plakobranchus ocellatus]|uniref:Uncharacterized protein n=1 Tax=Plakobranchus ocellatus TaxID=259542 RepID=A0AAV3ZYJ7_9GAST|nr:hypothetical protein PoB_002646800 [Plakobranchus ocellatus]